MNTRAFKNTAYQHLAAVGHALSSAPRLELLELLSQTSRTVEELATAAALSVANTSHHLQALKRAHLVHSQREGQHVRYSLADPAVAQLLQSLHTLARAQDAALARLEHDFFHARDALDPISAAELRARLDEGGLILLDVRPAEEFAAHHLPGAQNIPLEQLDALLHTLPADQPVVAYCRGPLCALSADAARQLRERGLDARHARINPATWLQDHPQPTHAAQP
jgi:ArsR family transcriptional regulator